MGQSKNRNIIFSKLSITLRLLYRISAAFILCGLSLPGVVMAAPLSIAFRIIKYRKISAGIAKNYDEVAQSKMVAIWLMVPSLTVLYSLTVARRFGAKYGKWF